MLLWQQLRKNEPSGYLRLLSTTFDREQGALIMIMTKVAVVIAKAPLENIHLRSCDYFAFISSCLYSTMLTNYRCARR